MREQLLGAAVFVLGACSMSGTADPVVSDPTPTAPASATLGTVPATVAESATVGESDGAPSVTTSAVDADAVVPNGFGRTAATVTMADGSECDLCLWLADDAEQRRRGLMFVTDLGGADGMAFRYPGPHTGRFWMRNTVLPLSIAFFDSDGVFLESFDMEPCTTSTCPRYPTAADFLVAVEVVQGELADHGLVEGSTLELLDRPCDL